MSFILDALKKLERQKQAEQGPGSPETVMEGGRRWEEPKRRWVVIWASVLVAVAALVVAVAALYRSWNAEPRAPVASETAVPSVHEPISEETPSSPSPMNEKGEQPPSRGSTGPSPATVRAPEDAGQAPPGARDSSEAETPAEGDMVETAPAVRLVGRGAEERPMSESGLEGSTDADLDIPQDLPDLVLQGTAVVDGKPVAVINYQRLFEGDTIEGAKVIRISDRVVELEFKGKRFVIKL